MTSKTPKKPEDDAAWQAEIATVWPLGTRRTKPLRAQPPAKTFVAPTFAPRHVPLQILSNHAEVIAGHHANIPPARLKELARGLVSPTAKLDLHGQQEGDAWLMLMNWLTHAAEDDHRCVLVVTGKGKGYGINGDMGIIKAQVATWLAAHPKVIAFHTAQPKDGGSGALYVLLKRIRA
ncbi:MAG: Smr/MutS family protein [Pseudomonadaceae bacterium]|nr:Smr/MutS family protein [Pseudomonadaceae bacterium]